MLDGIVNSRFGSLWVVRGMIFILDWVQNVSHCEVEICAESLKSLSIFALILLSFIALLKFVILKKSFFKTEHYSGNVR